ncbi:hypothetical_protein [Leishmania major strain Friedlin]|nr:hypothetical_protein [Leishmania major strain Friedlin]
MPLFPVASPHPTSGAAGGAALVSPAAVISAVAHGNGASWNKENDGARAAQPQRSSARPLSANASPTLVTLSPAPASFPNVTATPTTTTATTAVPCMSSEALRQRRCRICRHRLLVVAFCRPSLARSSISGHAACTRSWVVIASVSGTARIHISMATGATTIAITTAARPTAPSKSRRPLHENQRPCPHGTVAAGQITVCGCAARTRSSYASCSSCTAAGLYHDMFLMRRQRSRSNKKAGRRGT